MSGCRPVPRRTCPPTRRRHARTARCGRGARADGAGRPCRSPGASCLERGRSPTPARRPTSAPARTGAGPARDALVEARRSPAGWAPPSARRGRALARRAGIQLERLAPLAGAAPAARIRSPLNLTGREREVLLLLAAGRSNPQIAQELFISPKTASVHVSNIFAKLGVSSRVEAATLVSRLQI